MRALFVFAAGAVLLLSVMSCKSQKAASKEPATVSSQVEKKDSLLIKIKREACFGRCPQYYATVYKTGFVEYYGEMNVKKVGQWYAHLTNEQLTYLFDAIRQNKLESMDSVYVNPYLADYPAFALWVSVKGPRKKIAISHESPPVEIQEFTQLFEELLDRLQWDQRPKARRDEE